MVEKELKLTSSYFVMVSTGNEIRPEVTKMGGDSFSPLPSCDHPHYDCIHYLHDGSEEVLLNFFYFLGVSDSYQCS